MESENDGFQEELPFSGNFFSGSMLNFGGVSSMDSAQPKFFFIDSSFWQGKWPSVARLAHY